MSNTAVSMGRAQFETVSRFIASLLNEGLIEASVNPKGGFTLQGRAFFLHSCADSSQPRLLVCGTEEGWRIYDQGGPYHPGDFDLPIHELSEDGKRIKDNVTELKTIASVVKSILTPETVGESAWGSIVQEITNSAINQDFWFLSFGSSVEPTLESKAIEWERALLTGHPTHPMHRSCLAQPPLVHISPGEIASLLHPKISIIAVDSSEIKFTGPFQTLIKPLVKGLGLPELLENQIALPCLARQTPAILEHFSSARVVLVAAIDAEAQASLRTISLTSSVEFPWHMKLALACTITSALRTVSPWTACIGPEVSALLEDLLPEELWFCKEVASVTGAQKDFNEAKHISCVLREDLEPRANSLGQALVVCAALAEIPYLERECLAVKAFGLTTPQQKMHWFREYAENLIPLILGPALESGICLEAHGQNMLVRVDKSSQEIVGFVVRDFGGIKCHMPTLRLRGYHLASASSMEGSFIVTEVEEEAWDIIHHTLIQNHLQHLIRRLRLPQKDAWKIVRDNILAFFESSPLTDRAERFKAFLFRLRVHHKAFLRMKLQGLYRDYEHTKITNVMLTS